ncbi:MAG: alkane 1-monooxygenase [Kangiellaceae bacterium]|nr:alkane 1-monooxygenase [Kangiellaceae bacterium]
MYRYLFFFTVPLAGWISLTAQSYWSFFALAYSFGAIPLIELLIPADHNNYSQKKLESLKSSRAFDYIVYLALPFYIALLVMFLNELSSLDRLDYIGIGKVVAFGLMAGVMGINVGHELGHRHNRFERGIGELLLVFSMQTHFLPYHNHGHHRYVATKDDPATARENEWVYHFWFRSQLGSYFAAWRIEWHRLSRKNKNPLSLKNRMIRYSVLELALIIAITYLYGFSVLIGYLSACLIGALLLETVNYIEHYGLVRRLYENGRLERVTPLHSWNSDHVLGRALLFELSRHSDHHANASKPYQLLESYPNSPQMPTGYPGMMLLSLIPPLWFKVMNAKLINTKLINAKLK